MNGESMNLSPSNEKEVLRKLLTSWNLDCLLQHFINEGITVDVLLMLKPHHIPLLLRNFRLGIQIRFEHHLERWRHQIDKPLSTESSSYAPYNCYHHKKDLKTHSLPTVATQSPYLESQMHESAPPRPAISPPCSPATSQDSHETPLPPKLTAAPLVPVTAAPARKPPTQISSVPSAAPMTTLNTSLNQRPPKNPVFSGDDYRTPHVSVSLILSVSQPKGQQLLDYYRQNQCLTNAHRVQLINLIATYFDDNEYHLSLQTSYNMEREILKLFPSERIEAYRTEKRGKIYVKFCNMKRYKALREKPTKIRRYGCSLDSSGVGETVPAVDDMANTADDDFTMGFDTWDQPNATNDIYVKTENLTDEYT